MYKRACFVPPYFPRTLPVFEFIAFVSDFLCSFTEITVTVCARDQAAIFRYSDYSVKEIAKLFKKTERWVNKWSKRKSFEGKPRSGRLSVLTNYARNVIRKAEYKRNNSTRKIAQKVQHHNINVSSTKVWSLTNKGWKAFKRKKIPLLSKKQRSPRLKFARKYSKLTAEDWENFLFTDECRKYQVHYPNSESHIVWGSQECDVPPAYQLKQSAKVMVWGGMT